MRRTKMKLTNDNLEKVVDYIESQLADEDAGEFDEETSILSAVERTIEMFEENKEEKRINTFIKTFFSIKEYRR